MLKNLILIFALVTVFACKPLSTNTVECDDYEPISYKAICGAAIDSALRKFAEEHEVELWHNDYVETKPNGEYSLSRMFNFSVNRFQDGFDLYLTSFGHNSEKAMAEFKVLTVFNSGHSFDVEKSNAEALIEKIRKVLSEIDLDGGC